MTSNDEAATVPMPDGITEVTDRSARGIARGIGGMISSGRLSSGARLPTVRRMAEELGVSPATVSDAWQVLREAGLIDTAGRNGTRVTGVGSRPSGVGRYGRVSGIGRELAINLAGGTPDPHLLPDIAPLLPDIDVSTSVVDYLAPPVVEELGDLLIDEWPFEPGSLTVVDGVMDGLVRVAAEIVRFGSPVIVEDPTFPPLIDALERLGAAFLPVGVDAEGPVPEGVERALGHGPVAVFLQPRAHNPTGVSMSEERARTLAAMVASTDALIVENDHAADIADAPVVSLGRWLAGQTVRVRGFSKSHGPDLRLAALGGPSEVVEGVANRRVSGPGWSSRLLQRILVGMLTDEVSQSVVAEARRVYARRRAALVEALDAHGIEVTCQDGLNLWLPVADESQALVTLAAHGVAAAPGSAFSIGGADGDHIRVTVGLVVESDAEEIAVILASAARLDPPVRRA